MRAGPVASTAGVLLVGFAIAFAVWAEPIPEVRAPAPVVFVCRNGVAMSVWSAAYFNRLAEARGIRERAIARASIPSFKEVPWNMTLGRALDGFRLDGYRPHVVSADDVRSATLVVNIDTEMPPDARPDDARTEVWNGFPPMREQYFPSRKALKVKVEALVARLLGPGDAAAAARRP